MTKEEFRDYVDFLRSQDEISYDVYSGLIDGIDTLEQEPSEDDHDGCKDCVYQANPEDAMPCRECKQNYLDKWKAIPSAEPKIGHWKRISIDKYSEHAFYWYRCDRCGKDNLGNTDWCPNCGAKMVEPQESEG